MRPRHLLPILIGRILPLFSAPYPSDYLSFATGIYNVSRPGKYSWEVEMEYKVHLRWLTSPLECLEFRPLLGVMSTIQGAGYLYGGINFDLLFFEHLLIAPGFAAGYYWRGSGKNLGYPLEFRSGVELAWQFADTRRLGVHFYHLSNAGLGAKNPGEESLVFFYDIPLVKGFPFRSGN